MSTNNSTLTENRECRFESVLDFNVKTLKTLNYYGGYCTTRVLSIIHSYTKAGVRKRMNSMVKLGWINKIEHDQGLGRNEQLWCITKAGRIAAQTENDTFIDPVTLKGFSICDYSPALNSHTALVQVIANKLDSYIDHTELKPFKIDVQDSGQKRYIYPDIVFDTGIHEYNGNDVCVLDFYEIELTVKSLKRYKDLFIRIALHNEKASFIDDSYVIGDIIYITTPQLVERLKSVLLRVNTSIGVYLFDTSQFKSTETLNFTSAQIDLPHITEKQLKYRRR